MKTTPRITVVMPFRDRRDIIGQTIKSIQSQTYSDFELICVNDGSTDGADEYVYGLSKEDKRITLLHNSVNQNISSAANLGIATARADLIARMDSDDIATPNRLATQLKFMDSHPEIGLVGSWVRTFGDQGEHEWCLPTEHDDIRAQMLFCGALAQPAVMFRKTRFLEHNLRYDPLFDVTEDYDLWSRAAMLTRCANIPQILLHYRTHARNISTQRRSEIVMFAQKVHYRQLRMLGIVPADEDLDLHWRIADNNPDGKSDFYDRAFNWLDTLESQNHETFFLNPPALKRYLDGKRRWLEESEIITHGRPAPRQLAYIDTTIRTSDVLPDAKGGLPSTSFPDAAKEYNAISASNSRRLKIGMAVLIHERPDYLEMCLNSLFKTIVPEGIELTVALVDDGSVDPSVQIIMDLDRQSNIKIYRYYTAKSANNWGAAFNKAMKILVRIDNFDLIGTSDSDALFHPEWLSHLVPIALWAKSNHTKHNFGPFSAFNSSDADFHEWQGVYSSPHGDYIIKNRMGALNYFYFIEDFMKLGFFSEDRDDETRMTEMFKKLEIRNLSTKKSYVEHLGQDSVLNRWRPSPVRRAVHGLNLPKYRWPSNLRGWETVGYFKDVVDPLTSMPDVESKLPLSVIYVCLDRDKSTLELSIASIKRFLRHPVQDIIIVGDSNSDLPEMAARNGARFVSELDLLPIRKADILYRSGASDRSGWLYQQLLKFAADAIIDETHYLLMDADTMLVRPQVFECGGKDLILHSDEFHPPYFSAYARLVGNSPVTFVSSVSHQALINRSRLRELKAHVEANHSEAWFRAIINCTDYANASGFSEYETYAQWSIMNYSCATRREYFSNASIPRQEGLDLGFEGVLSKFAHLRSVSMHWYL